MSACQYFQGLQRNGFVRMLLACNETVSKTSHRHERKHRAKWKAFFTSMRRDKYFNYQE